MKYIKKLSAAISKSAKKKLNQTKDYFMSEKFEDDLDYLIINLQMFDSKLVVPNMNRINGSQRINKKINIVRSSFIRLNVDYAPLGMTAGSYFGPKGLATGSLLGTYIFIGCMGVSFWKRYNEIEQSGLVPNYI